MRPPLLLLALALPAAPTVAATRDFPLRGFDRVELAAAADVAVTVAPRFSVRAEGDGRLLQRLTATVQGDRLVLGWLDGGPRIGGDNHIRITVAMPRVAGAAVSGAGSIAIDRADAPDFSADVGGAGAIRIAALRADHARLTMGGTGQIVAAGRAVRLDSDISGAGTIDALNLTAASGRFALSGTGKLRARVDGPASISLSGIGSVVVAGNPRCTIQKSGVGTVRCG